MDFKDFLEELRKLKLPNDQYAIFGSGPLAVRDIREAEDLDIIVTEGLYKELESKYRKEGCGLVFGNIEIISPQASVVKNPEELIKRAEDIEGFEFVLLKDIVEWKKEMGREKDLKDIELVEEYLKNV